MRRFMVLTVFLLLLALPAPARAGILNLRGGLGTVVKKDRDTRDSVRYGAALLAASYRTPYLEFALDLPLRWETQTREFDKSTWDRKGDLLRPLSVLRYSTDAGKGRVQAGLEVISDWTPGDGLLVRNLSGAGEIDYVLPGARFRWSNETFALDAGTDRIVDPAVQSVAVKWRATRGITLVVEGAVDPEAPVAFTGASSGGRPRADSTERLSAGAAGLRFALVEGELLDLGVGVHAGEMKGDSKGLGADVSATLDFTNNYVNRLNFLVRSVNCEGGYVPAWFDAAYTVLRWGPEGQSFLGLNPLDAAVPDRTMLSLDIQYDLGDFFSVSAGVEGFDDDSLRRARFEAKLREENGRGLELSIWSRADDPDVKLFSVDSNLHSRASALYNFLPHFLLNISYESSWAFREEEAGFKPLNSIQLGVVYDISL